MAVLDISGSALAVLKQVKPRPQTLKLKSRKSLEFYNFSPTEPLILEAIEELHSLYMTRRARENSLSESAVYENVLKILQDYLIDMVKVLKHLSFKERSTAKRVGFKEMGLVARLVETFFISRTPTYSLIGFIKDYGTSSDQSVSFDKAAYWNGVFTALRTGDLEAVKEELKKHENYPRFRAIFQKIEQCLNPACRIFGHPYGTSIESEFMRKFEDISRESNQLLKDVQNKAENYPELNELIKLVEIIAGKHQKFSEINPSWAEHMLLHLLFVEGIFYDQENIASFTRRTLNQLDDYDAMLLGTIETSNMHKLIQKCSEYFPSVFVAHLTEVLAIVRKVPLEPEDRFEGLSYPEHYFYVYFTEIMPIKQVKFNIVCDYLIENLAGLEDILHIVEYCIALRIDSTEVKEVVEYLESKEMNEVLNNVYKFLTMYLISKKQYKEALLLSFEAPEPLVRENVEQHLLTISLDQSPSEINDFLNSLPQNIRHSSILVTFFCKYLEFCENVQNNRWAKAGQLLVNFCVNETAPLEFLPRILDESQTLLASGAVFSEKDIVKILEVYERVCKDKSTQLQLLLAQSAMLSICNPRLE